MQRTLLGIAVFLAVLVCVPFELPADDAFTLPYTREENVVYGETAGVGLVMDVFRPNGAKPNGLAVIDVVSGAWYSDRGKLRDHEMAQVFAILCKRGYTVFGIRPGSVSKFSVLEMIEHLKQGVRWVRANADRYGVDPDRMGLMGASAGGHLASLLTVTLADELRSAGKTPDGRVEGIAAVAVFFPPTDFLDFGGREVDVKADDRIGRAVRRLAFPDGVDGLSEEAIRGRLVEISPARRVKPGLPPFLLIHGDADPVVPLQQSRAMVAALKQAQVPVELIVKPGGGHPWLTIHEEVARMADWFDKTLAVREETRRDAAISQPSGRIVIDGRFDDWAGIRSYRDPQGDPHTTTEETRSARPELVAHPDVDLLEYAVAHDNEALYFRFRSLGHIGRTQKAGPGREAGRYYVIVTIDVDNDDETGYWLHEGGYFPTSRGYDVNAEIEYYDGTFNTACYLNHGARTDAELAQAFLDQSSGRYRPGHDGPYPAGFLRVKPGTYRHYTQWVYHADDTITFVRDKGPVVLGIATAAVSKDGHQLEARFPYKGFLKDEHGKPIVALGRTIDLSFSLEASGELAPGRQWASDTGEPIEGYRLLPLDREKPKAR